MPNAICENNAWSISRPRLIYSRHGDRDHNQWIILQVDLSQGGEELGVQMKCPRDVSLDKTDKLVFL